MISYQTKRSHARSRINRIFSRVVFLERKLGVSVFSSLFMWRGISPVESDFVWQSQRKINFKNGFSFAGSHLPCRKIYLVRRSSVLFPSFLYLIGNYSVFPSIFFHFTFFQSSIGNPSFPFLFFLFISSFPIFDWEFGF